MLWDVGANVGSYSCYAAKARTCRVYAFEPSVFNLELLARNIALNRLTDRITVVPLPLTEALGESTLNMMTTEPGGAMSSFGVDHGHDGKPIEAIFQVRTIGFSMQDAVTSLGIPQPDYIKMDVDGIEHLILGGGADVLQNVRSVLVEINDDFERQAVMAVQHLSAAGLILNDKRRAAMFDNTAYASSYNQIWRRSNGVD